MRDSIVKLGLPLLTALAAGCTGMGTDTTVNGVGPVWSGWAARTTEATSPSA